MAAPRINPVARPATATIRHETRRPLNATTTSVNTGTRLRMPPTSLPSHGAPSITTTTARSPAATATA